MRPSRGRTLYLIPSLLGKIIAGLAIATTLHLPASVMGSHSWGYDEWILMDFTQKWINADRVSACETLKKDIDDPNWGSSCTVGGERSGGRINRGCSNANPGNVEGGCEAELVFCRLITCLDHAPHVPINLPMTAFRCETHGYSYDFTTDTCGIPKSNPGKERGSCKPEAGNPCNPISGNKSQRETDYTGAGPFALRFQRFYNSVRVALSKPGADWRHTYDRSIHAGPISLLGSEAQAARSDGQILTFSFIGGVWISDPDVRERLEEELDVQGVRTGWRLTDANGSVEQYDASGRLVAITNREGFGQILIYNAVSGLLQTVTDPFGRTLSLSHDPNGRLESLTDPGGNVYEYNHDGNGNLVTVVYPDETPSDGSDNPRRIYHYENARFPYHLTGITDENGSRFSTYAYDGQGRAVLSTRTAGANAITITYNTDGTSTVMDALGNQTVYTVESIFGVRKTTVFDQPCALCQNKNAANSYDGNGFPASSTDFNGNLISFGFDQRGLELSRTEAAGTPEARTITTEWHQTFRRPVKIIQPGRETTFSYDSVGRLLTRTVTDVATGASRTTTRSHTPEGLLESIDGPRTDARDITRFHYDAAGNLIKTVNALGHETNLTAHDAHGRPLTLVDANGVVTRLRYDARNRLVSREVDGSLTRFEYDGVGNVTRVTLPDGSFIAQEYDGANRLIAMTDNRGNRIAYTLDALGNRTAEQTFDPGGVLTRSMRRVYNLLNRLTDETGGEKQTTHFAYDPQGNLIAVTDPNNRWTVSNYDALNRLIETIAPDDGVTRFAYDGRDNLVAVTDPRSLRTSYLYNGFDEIIETSSPDTGLSTQNYDEAGNRVSSTDARGIKVSLEYDVLNRLTAIRYPDLAENVSFEYDQGPNGIGRLTRISDQSGVIDMGYDGRGNLITEARTIDGIIYTTGYVYDAADRLLEMTYPSGLVVGYERDLLGRVSAVTMTKDGVTRGIASGLEYAPFGPRTALAFGNGIQLTRTLDGDYRLAVQRAGAVQDLSYQYDAADNILGIQDGVDPARNQMFGYDGVNRLLSADSVVYGDRIYAYDPVGNRLARTANGDTDTYFYSATANQLDAITGPNAETFLYDAAGNSIQKGPTTFVYNDANRLESVWASGQLIAEYTYNAKGERVKKVVAGETAVFHYDQSGNLLAEYDDEGNALRDYIWLDGERLAIVAAAGGPDLTFSGSNQRTGDDITLGIYLEHQTIEIEDRHGLSGSYALTGKQWKLGESGVLKLSFKGEGVHFEGNLHLETLEGTFGGRTRGPWHPYKVTGEEGGASPEGLFFIHTDHLGTPKVITDESQKVVWDASHTPFGTALISVNELENNLRFPGQYFDGETGLHYNLFRDYDPRTGRYIESDPIGLSGGSQTYAYAGNDPLSNIDLMGLCRIEVRFNQLFSIDNTRPPISVSHAFIVTTNTDGSERYYRGGPSGLGFFGNWGTIETESGAYVPGTPDFPSDNLPSLTLADDDKDCACYDKALEKAIDQIEALKIPYSPLGPNSNTTVSNALRSIGYSKLPEIPWSILVPGWIDRISGLELKTSVCCE
jgi:RHS repeat-associated protein